MGAGAQAFRGCAALYEKNRVLALGQFISLLIAFTGVFTQTLNQNYQIAWWKYVLLALADVEGNFLAVCAYKYTSISSAMLLDCFTIPAVMLLSAGFLSAKYTRMHFVAVGFCLGGITILVVSDILRDKANWDGQSNWNASALYGDFLCLLGSSIYACSNVGQEYLVKKKDRQVFLKDGDAAVFNLSLLTSDFFAVVAAKYLFNEELSWLYFVGFSMIIAGLLIYNRSDAPTSDLDDKLEARQGTTIQLLASADHV
ncbi:Drug/metabolite transporter, partial [Globisporangium splendens]